MTLKMQASVLARQGVLEVRGVDRPRPAPDQVLVKIAAVGICGSDVHYFHEGRIGEYVVESPLILGHEASGTIVEVGGLVSPDRIGQRVSIEPQRSCRTCAQCKAGRYNLCPQIEFYATPPVNGAFAEYAAIQADFAHPIPDSLTLDAAALCEPLSVGIWSNQKAGTSPGTRVLIAGAGPIGLICAQVARAFGAAVIAVSDPVAARRDVALRYGASLVIDPLAARNDLDAEYDVFIDASGAAPAVRAGILALAPAGRAVLVGMGADEYPLPVSRIQARELTVTGVFRYANTWPLAIELAASGAVDLDSLITGRYGLDGVEAGFAATRDPGTIKVVVAP